MREKKIDKISVKLKTLSVREEEEENCNIGSLATAAHTSTHHHQLPCESFMSCCRLAAIFLSFYFDSFHGN